MRKKFVYIGVALIVIGIAIFLASGAMLNNEVGRNATYHNITVGRNAFVENVSTVNESTLLIMAGVNNATNIYILNRSGYDEFGMSAYPSNISAFAQGDQGGIIKTYENTTLMELLLTDNMSGTRNSSINASSIALFPDSAYVVFQQGALERSTSHGIFVYEPFSKNEMLGYKNMEIELLALSIISFVSFVSGIALVLYGVFKHADAKSGGAGEELPEGKLSKEYIDSLYKGIDKKKRRRSKG